MSEILKATETVKSNLRELEKQVESCPVEEKKEVQNEMWQTMALLRNLNLLLIDIFKEFD